jgi:UDP-glucose 4-epimerase
VSATLRNRLAHKFDPSVDLINIGDMTPTLDWSRALIGIDVIIHLAARAHVLNDAASNPIAEYRYVNVDCSLNLARQAAQVGVKRFIYLSSIKVNGEFTSSGEPFKADDIPSPKDFYGVSKYEAELGLRAIADEVGMELVIIRPPLVYGSGVKGNFLNMMRWIAKSVPLPLGAINNLRSLVGLENLVDLIIVCIKHVNAANQIFLVSDDEDLSTPDLCINLGIALNSPAKLVKIPVPWLYFFTIIVGRRKMLDRLCSSLQVDILKTKKMLGWSPKVSVSKGFAAAVCGYLNKKSQ